MQKSILAFKNLKEFSFQYIFLFNEGYLCTSERSRKKRDSLSLFFNKYLKGQLELHENMCYTKIRGGEF